jgi:hypothetical protein
MYFTALRKGLEFDALKAIESVEGVENFASGICEIITNTLDKFVYMTEDFNGTYDRNFPGDSNGEKVAVALERVKLLDALKKKAFAQAPKYRRLHPAALRVLPRQVKLARHTHQGKMGRE